jgi:glycosyltransferase involved in cell wall biosynthesis
VSLQSIREREHAGLAVATGWPSRRGLRIAHVVPVYPPRRGGVGRVAQEYALRLRERGHDVQVFTARHADLANVPDYVRPLASPIRVGNAAFIPSLAWRLDGFDLVHFHYPFFGGVEPVLLRRLLRPRQALVVSYHMDAVAEGLRGAMFDVHQRLILPTILGQADRVLVSSLDYARASLHCEGIDRLPHVEVHPYGVDLRRFRPGPEPALRTALGGDAKTPLLLFVAALDPAHHFKGFPVLIDALRDLRDAAWRLVVVGDGASRAEHVELARATGLGARVHFAGDVSDEDLPRYYRAADIHLFPSTAAAEAFGLVCLEAAASATPTIASALPGVRRVVLDDETGLHVAPCDVAALRAAIRVLIERPDVRSRLGAAARARAEVEFDWDTRIVRLEETYFAVAAPTTNAASVAAV